jgi:Flp pilus assembly protein TadD
MAYAAIGAHDPAVAIDATNKVLEKEPKNVEAVVAKSYALLLQKDIDGARALARQARDIDPRAQLPPELEGLLR